MVLAPKEDIVSHEGSATALWSIGTAVPTHRVSQEDVCRFMQAYHRSDAALGRRLQFIYRRSQIDFRYYGGTELFHPTARHDADDRFPCYEPSTRQRMQVYEAEAVELAETAAQHALGRQTHVTAADITHLVVVTCTGFFSPGPDLLLIDRLGLRPDIRRLQIGFMGCHAALQGLQTADAICRSDPQAVVLLVCVELCTLHLKRTPTEENLIINSLFGDGAAAAVLSSTGYANGQSLCQLDHFASHVCREARDSISWHIGDHGFQMGLALSNAKDLQRLIPDFVGSSLMQYGWRQDEVDLWAVHPGGRAILDACQRALALPPEALAGSRAIMRAYGNMSSPTVLFVMDHLLTTHTALPARGMTLAFGPGIALEGMLWCRRNGHD